QAASTTDAKGPDVRAANALQARQLLQEGYQALQKDDLLRARQLAEKARDLHPDLPPGEPTPEKLLADIGTRASRVTTTSVTGMAAAGAGQALQGPGGRGPDSTEQARQLLREGKQALAAGDLVRARQLAEHARDLHPVLNWYEDNPERLLA